jgi:hypothetical protein
MAAAIFQRWLERWKQARIKAAGASKTANGENAQAEYLKTLADARRRLEEESYKVEAAYDKTLIALSGGALAISVAFLKDVAPHPAASTIWILRASWLFLVGSLLSILTSMLTSQRAFDQGIEDLDRRLEAARDGTSVADDEVTARLFRRYANATRWLNRFSAGLFVAGAFLFLAFATLNVVQGEASPAAAPSGITGTPEERGAIGGGHGQEGDRTEAAEAIKTEAEAPRDSDVGTGLPVAPEGEGKHGGGGSPRVEAPGVDKGRGPEAADIGGEAATAGTTATTSPRAAGRPE